MFRVLIFLCCLVMTCSPYTVSAQTSCTPTCPDPCSCPPNPPSGVCIVLSEEQLRDALAGDSTCTNCTPSGTPLEPPDHIRIPAGTVICVQDAIEINGDNDDLLLEIAGTIKYTGVTGAAAAAKAFCASRAE